MILIGNGAVITRNDANPFIENGCVCVDGTEIKDIGTAADMKAKYPNAQFKDVNGKIIMPGLINVHTHIYSAFARGMGIKNAPVNKNFSDILKNLWWRLDKKLTMENVKYSAYATFIDCVKNGVTTVFDHHASQTAITGSLFAIGDVAEKLGVRACLCYEVTDRDGEAATDAAIAENTDFIRHAGKQADNMQKGMFGMHASMTLSDKTMEKAVKAMQDAETGFHIHAAEGTADVFDSLQKYGKRVVNRLFDFGLLGPKTIAVHCVHINGGEMDLLKQTDTAVVHNPESNMGNAVGCPAVMAMMEKGIMVGLGTDGYTSDMLESYKAANLIHKHHLCDPGAAWGEAPQMLFDNNRAIAERFFDGKLGVLEEGAPADIIVVDYDPPTPMTKDNINAHLLFGINGRNVFSTMINGRFVYENREMIDVCEKEIFAKCRESAARLWNDINR